MQYNNLPCTSVKVSRMCLGTMMFGDQANEADSIRMIDYALIRGLIFMIPQHPIIKV